MFEVAAAGLSRTEARAEILAQIGGLLAGERDRTANCANVSALLYTLMPELNWAGFYFLKPDGWLVLGPFQGKPACVRIGPGKGVCGAAVVARAPVRVADVFAFPGHIACDAQSRAELVVPIIREGVVLGVIDLDSPVPGRFEAEDAVMLGEVAALVAAGCDW